MKLYELELLSQIIETDDDHPYLKGQIKNKLMVLIRINYLITAYFIMEQLLGRGTLHF